MLQRRSWSPKSNIHGAFGLWLPRSEQKDCNLTQIEVDEVLRFVRDVTAVAASNNYMPCGAVLFVKLLLYVCGLRRKRRIASAQAHYDDP